MTEKSLPTRRRYLRHTSAHPELFSSYGAAMTTHTYTTHVDWSGSTGDGYRAYSRDHRAGDLR